MSPAWNRALALLAVLAAGCVGPATAPPPDVRAALAPTGKLRVGLYPGSPTSYIPAATGGEAKGVGYEVGREMAARLGVPFEPAVFPANAQLLDAVKAGQVDVILTNATAERRGFIDFSDPLIELEKGYLVPAGSPIADAAAVDRDGVRVGVSKGSSSERELAGVLHRAKLVPAPSLEEAGRMLSQGTIDAFGTNKAILFEMGDRLAGSRVLPGVWGHESFALGVPKGRDAGHAWLQSFVRTARAEGVVSRAAQHAGLRGTAADGVK
ncbi:MAG TPA: transporter substrate-binding domain-containing protein [Usitatibacter sp.]|nr:transporter substrate-binding domain-containing protein [Usitatibacter sp.]